ncbi:MAG: zinc ribbon domain-containing protein [Eubacterium sp.]
MSDSKVYTLKESISIQMVAENVQRFLSEQKKLISEAIKTSDGYLVQAKAAENWKKFAGMDAGIQVQLSLVGDHSLSANIGSGKWVDKAATAAVGALIFWPLLATSAVGAWGQKKLPEDILNFIDQYVSTGTYPSLFTMENVGTFSAGSGVTCPNCHSFNPVDSKFCQRCGLKLGIECPHCNASIPADTKFCPRCGGSVIPDKEPAADECPNCHTPVSEDQKFCPKCGTPIVHMTPKILSCHMCGAVLAENQKFCPECGAPVVPDQPATIECSTCHTVLDASQKFCPECGTPVTVSDSNTPTEENKNIKIEGDY